ncbi:MAG: tetratricopeptide repeat protein [Isosphaeraceae bacterium]
MPRRPAGRSRSRAKAPAEPKPAAPRPGSVRSPGRGRRGWVLAGVLGVAVVGLLVLIVRSIPESPERLRAEAESAARAGDWTRALRAWRALNATRTARGATHLGEARACLALNLAAQAERSLRRAIAADPADPEPWRLLLQILRVEDRTREAQDLGWQAYDRVPPAGRRALLRELTLALLADLPDETARTTLHRWIQGDEEDVDARVALLQRIAAQPRADDPDRDARMAQLEAIVAEHPDHPGAREALGTVLADAYEPDRGRAVLDGWPGSESARDARYWRLRGRWDLEYDHRPDRAVDAFRRVVATLPQDWRSWSGLARSLRRTGRDAEAHQAAETVSRIREALDPLSLIPSLDAAFKHLDDPDALRDLADLAARVGLARLADAWRVEARAAESVPR